MDCNASEDTLKEIHCSLGSLKEDELKSSLPDSNIYTYRVKWTENGEYFAERLQKVSNMVTDITEGLREVKERKSVYLVVQFTIRVEKTRRAQRLRKTSHCSDLFATSDHPLLDHHAARKTWKSDRGTA